MILAIIGSGGKTTAMKKLAEELKDQRVLMTTTTHILPVVPPESRVLVSDPTKQALLAELRDRGIVCAGCAADDRKLGALPEELLRAGTEAADVTLCEADGSRRLPLKLHRKYEPVLPENTDLCLIVAGLSALGEKVWAAVHRFDEHPQWKNEPQHIVGTDEFVYCLQETAEASGMPKEKIRMLINQVDSETEKEKARPIAEEMQSRGYDCRMGSLLKDEPFLKAWLLPEA